MPSINDFLDMGGWIDDKKKVAQEMEGLKHPLFLPAASQIKDSGEGKVVLLYKFVEKLIGEFNVRTQSLGDCTSFGAATAVDCVKAAEIVSKKENEDWFAETATEPIYIGSRINIGKGQLGNGGGSYGIWTAKCVNDIGAMGRADYSNLEPGFNLKEYNPEIAESYSGSRGKGLSAKLVLEAGKYKIRTISQVSTYTEVRDAVANGYAVIICSNQGFSNKRDKEGFAAPSGNWAHCMAIIAVDDKGEGCSRRRPGTLVQNCFSEDTEVLTENGWYLFSELPKNIKVATINPDSGELEYQYPSEYQDYEYNGEMIHFHGRVIDCLVTPNHNMLYISKYFRETKNTKWRFKEAKEVKIDDNFRKDIDKWNGTEQSTINILNYNIDMDIWLEFLGYFLSEGWANTRIRERKRNGSEIIRLEKDGYVGIAQNEGRVLERMKFVTDNLPWNFKLQKLHGNNSGYQIISYNYEFANYMKQFGKAHQKFIPEYVFMLSSRQLKIIFNSLMDGDGCWSTMRYTTNSIQLKDGFQRLCLHLGYSTDYNVYMKKGMISSNNVLANHDIFSIGIKNSSYSKPCIKNIDKINYNGRVYCVTVPNHTVFIRRNGKTLFTGQSWGPSWISGPKRHNQPDGSFWVDADDIERYVLRSGDCWVFSDFSGYPPKKLNLRII